MRIEHVGVVGAGLVGLSTAWFLQQHGVQVTVLDRAHPGAGASWGNAGWLTPELTTPLPHPSVLRYGLRALVAPSSPVYVPPNADPRLIRFLASFARHSTRPRWSAAMEHFAPMNRGALAAYDELTDGGVRAETVHADPFVAAFRDRRARDAMLADLDQVAAAGQEVKADVLDEAAVHEAVRGLGSAVTAGVRLHGQRYVDPPAFVRALADSVYDRLGTLVDGCEVRRVSDDTSGVVVHGPEDHEHRFDAVVIANGAWLSRLARPYGVRVPVQAGRGYSFSVNGADLPTAPVYFPSEKVACTPFGSGDGRRLRVAGTMEFRNPDAALDRRRIAAVVASVRPLLTGADLGARVDEWVGSRPCTPDGLPLIGRTASPRVFVAGGHGMWGIAWGPLTGRLLAQQMVTGVTPPQALPFDPLR